ncbi:MAG: FtsH protease activity modulator HflK [Alphaproteobacteria bacterium]
MSNNKSPWGSGPSGNGSGGGKKPWGQGGRPDRNKPKAGETSPDLDNVIQGFKSQFGRGGRGPRGGGGNGGGSGPLAKFGPFGIFLLLGGILLVGSSFYTVDQQEEALVLRFGEYSRTAPPGLNFKFPVPMETVIKRKTREVKKIDIGGSAQTSLMLTGDENIVDIDFTVLWRINDLNNFIFNVDNTEEAVRAVAESAMREIVGKSELEGIITTDRLSITLAVRNLMQETLNEYEAGVEVVEVQLQKADPPEAGNVIDAFRDVVNAAQDAETVVNEATAYQNQVVPEARGEASQIIQDAEAYKGKVVAEARGEAERFKLVLAEYLAAPEVTRKRIYLETMEEVYAPADKIILDKGAGSGVVPYLPLDKLNAKPRGGQ